MGRRKLKDRDLNRIRRFCAGNPKRITTGLVVKDLALLYPNEYPALVASGSHYSLAEENNYRKVIRDYLRELEGSGYLKIKAEPVYDNTGTLQKNRKRYVWYLPNVQPKMQIMIKMDEFKLMIQAACENSDQTDPFHKEDHYILEALSRILMGTNDIDRWKAVLEEECRLMMMEPLYSQGHTSFLEKLKKVFERLDSVFTELSSR